MGKLRNMLTRLLMLMVTTAAAYGQAPLVWEYPTGGSPAVAVSADGQYVAAGGYAGGHRLHLFSTDQAQPLWTYLTSPTGNGVEFCRFSRDGQYIAAGENASSGRRSGTFHLFDREKGSPLWTYQDPFAIDYLSVSADGQYTAALFRSYVPVRSRLLLFHYTSAEPVMAYESDEFLISAEISLDGQYVVVGSGRGSEAGRLYVFGRQTAEPLWSYEAPAPISGVPLPIDSQYIIARSGGSIYWFVLFETEPAFRYDAAGRGFALSDNGAYLATASPESNRVFLYHNYAGELTWSAPTRSAVWGVSISADGDDIASSSGPDDEGPAFITFFSQSDSQLLWEYRVNNTPAWPAVAQVSADGRYVAVSEMFALHLLLAQ